MRERCNKALLPLGLCVQRVDLRAHRACHRIKAFAERAELVVCIEGAADIIIPLRHTAARRFQHAQGPREKNTHRSRSRARKYQRGAFQQQKFPQLPIAL